MTERQDASGHQALRNGVAWDALRTIRVAIEGYLPPGGILPADDILSSLTAEAAELVRGIHKIGRPPNDARDRLWQMIADMMLVAQFDGVITDANQAWASTLGWSKPELVGRNLFDFIHPDDLHRTRTAARTLSEGAIFLHFDNGCRHKDGSYHSITWVAVAGHGHIHAVGHDCTSEKEQANAIRRTEDALRQSQKMAAVGQLTGGIAHDFNNLLTGISASLELLHARLTQGKTDDLAHYITMAGEASKRAAALTHRLLAFSRQQTAAARHIDVSHLVNEMEEWIRRTVGPEVVVEVSTTSGLESLVDQNQLENALLNLCINARDAMPQGGRLTIETASVCLDERMARELDLPSGQYVALSVRDTGSGMASEVVQRAFDPFFTTKPSGMGTGLGLSMIYGFVHESGGRARIDSKPNQGTTVCLYLPHHVGEVAQAEEARQIEAPAALAEASHADQRRTVLVVEDERTVRELISEVLVELGYSVIAVADGVAGLEHLQSDTPIDLLVTDIGLPGGMNGRQLADASGALHPGLEVLFITGYADGTMTGQLDLEAPVLTKPFTMEALVDCVHKIFSRRLG
jgi:PAS domain S-box-containing protein